jgi:hypothetical protein
MEEKAMIQEQEFKQFIGMRLIASMVVFPTPSQKGLALIFEDRDGSNHKAIPIPIYEVKSPDYNQHASMLTDRELAIIELQEVIKKLNREIASKDKIIKSYKNIIEEME